MAIQNDVLTRYYYYPICVSLNDEEREKYRELTDKIRKLMQNKDNIENEELLEMLLIKRARIIAGAENKLTVLKEELEKHRGEYNILIYCGAAKSPNIEYDDSGEDIRQINSVLQILDKEIGMIASKFTSEESSSERSLIIESFKNKVLNAIVAIKCLDEGVNIPSIEKAFILASSTNPKEYIQRRGRVLRKSEGKKYSYIYDFITLPFDIEQTMRFGEGSMDLYAGMVRNEVIRMKDFASLAENSYDCEELIYDLERIFNLNLKGEESWK